MLSDVSVWKGKVSYGLAMGSHLGQLTVVRLSHFLLMAEGCRVHGRVRLVLEPVAVPELAGIVAAVAVAVGSVAAGIAHSAVDIVRLAVGIVRLAGPDLVGIDLADIVRFLVVDIAHCLAADTVCSHLDRIVSEK